MQTLVSVVGLRRADQNIPRPASLEVRLHLRNHGPATVRFDPASLEMVAGNLKAFPPPIVEPRETIELEASESAEIVAFFLFPDDRYPGAFDLEGLNVSWVVRGGARPVLANAAFQRATPRYDPYGPHYRFGFGFGHAHHHGYYEHNPWWW